MDENKIYDLLEKIYIEVQNHGKRLDKVDGRLDKVDRRLDSIENEVKKTNMRIDEELIPTDAAILDGYKANAEHITEIDDKLDRLQMDVNNISMKVSYNDNRIIEISKNLKKVK